MKNDLSPQRITTPDLAWEQPFYVAGPTASGKTSLAVCIAQKWGGEVVNADAFQLYRGLSILTARPQPEEMQEVPHHLFGILPPEEHFDAQRYRELALPVIQKILGRGKLPIVVGGSGLYIKALSHGLADLPPSDPQIRARLREMPLPSLVAELLKLDPEAEQNVPMANPRYVERALEICLLTGQPQSALRQTFHKKRPWGSGIVLQWERPLLHERIQQRVQQMLQAGAAQEVASLGPEVGALGQAIGVKELQALLAGQMSREAAAEAILIATRQYAKRQSTWFRRETWLQTICLSPGCTADSLFPLLQAHLPCQVPLPILK